MQHTTLVIYNEIVHQRTIGHQCLRTHTCWPRQKISGTQTWHIALQRLEACGLAEVPVHLLKANSPVPERHLTEPNTHRPKGMAYSRLFTIRWRTSITVVYSWSEMPRIARLLTSLCCLKIASRSVLPALVNTNSVASPSPRFTSPSGYGRRGTIQPVS